jgi:hypothetical protein
LPLTAKKSQTSGVAHSQTAAPQNTP